RQRPQRPVGRVDGRGAGLPPSRRLIAAVAAPGVRLTGVGNEGPQPRPGELGQGGGALGLVLHPPADPLHRGAPVGQRRPAPALRPPVGQPEGDGLAQVVTVLRRSMGSCSIVQNGSCSILHFSAPCPWSGGAVGAGKLLWFVLKLATSTRKGRP